MAQSPVQVVQVRHPDGGEPVDVWVVKGRRAPWGSEHLVCIPSHPDPETATRFLPLNGFAEYVRVQVQAQIEGA